MNRFLRIGIIVIGVGLIAAIAYFFMVRPIVERRDTTNSGSTETEASTETGEESSTLEPYQELAAGSTEELLVLGINEELALGTPELYITSFSDEESAEVTDKIDAIYSNYVPATESWFTVRGNNLYKHTFASTELISQLPFDVVRSPSEIRNGIAASPDGTQLAWITRVDTHHEVVLFDIATRTAERIFGEGEASTFYSVVWSPDGQELAMVNQDQQIVTIDTQGVEPFAPFNIHFSHVTYLEWIEENTLAAVLTSTVDNPNPFSPKIGLFDRRGVQIEEHPIADNVGVPRVIWSDDGLRYAYYIPWQSQFVVYDRFDQLQHIVDIQESGSFAPFGWTTGTTPPPLASDTAANFDIDFSSIFDSETPTAFDVTGDEWEGLNLITKDVVEQFKIEPDSYRFNVDTEGTIVSFSLKEKQNRPEQVFIQVALQSLALLEDVPSISLTVTLADGTVLERDNFTQADAEAVVNHFTTVDLPNLFVVTAEEPQGKPAAKVDVPEHTYLGDLLYSSSGHYNPYPALTFMGTVVNGTSVSLWQEPFSTLYPNHWLVRNLGEEAPQTFQPGDALFYTADTQFRSTSAWEGFGVAVRQFFVPTELTLEQWLEVNRPNLGATALDRDLQDPLEGVTIDTGSENTVEYVLKSGGTVYTINYANNEPISDADRAALRMLLDTFTDHSVFQRGI